MLHGLSRGWALVSVIGMLGCMPRNEVEPAASQLHLVGRWNVSRVGGGMTQFAFDVTDVNDGSVRGTLLRILSGNVGIDVSRYQPLDGNIDGAQVVLASVDRVSGTRLSMTFHVVGDGLEVATIEWAGEVLTSTGGSWTVWREH